MIVLAWATPVVWVVVAVFAGPSDGTTISNPSSFAGDQRWDESVTVVREYGETPLREGDLILAIDGRTLEDWVDGDARAERALGDDVTYRVRRSGEDLDRVLDLEVSLIRYPLGDALADNLATTVLVLGLLVSGTFLFWSRPREATCRAVLAAGAGVAAGLTAYPLGFGAIDLAGSRGVWPHLGGELLCTLALGALLVAALTFPWTRAWLRSRRARLAGAVPRPLRRLRRVGAAVRTRRRAGPRPAAGADHDHHPGPPPDGARDPPRRGARSRGGPLPGGPGRAPAGAGRDAPRGAGSRALRRPGPMATRGAAGSLGPPAAPADARPPRLPGSRGAAIPPAGARRGAASVTAAGRRGGPDRLRLPRRRRGDRPRHRDRVLGGRRWGTGRAAARSAGARPAPHGQPVRVRRPRLPLPRRLRAPPARPGHHAHRRPARDAHPPLAPVAPLLCLHRGVRPLARRPHRDRDRRSAGSADRRRARGRRGHPGSARARGDSDSRTLRATRPTPSRGHRRAGGSHGAGGGRQPRAAALAGAPGQCPRGGTSTSTP